MERGAGLAQPGMAAAEARLAAGDWVHVFPEGTRSRDGRMGPARRGVGRLVAACAVPPLGARLSSLPAPAPCFAHHACATACFPHADIIAPHTCSNACLPHAQTPVEHVPAVLCL